MATQDDVPGIEIEKLNENLARVEELSKRLVSAFASHESGQSYAGWAVAGFVCKSRYFLLDRDAGQPRQAVRKPAGVLG